MGRFLKWIKHMEKWFFTKETVVVEKQQHKKQIGRVQVVSRDTSPKMIHHYPKQGKFRFPVIEDKAHTNRVPVQKEEQPINERKKTEIPVAKQQFKLTNIPSPVFGFRERPKKSIKRAESISENSEPMINDPSYNVEYASNGSNQVNKPELFPKGTPSFAKDRETFDSMYNTIEEVEEAIPHVQKVEVIEEVNEETEQDINQLVELEEKKTIEEKQEKQEIHRPSEKSKDAFIPYNVMMLPKDRRKEQLNNTPNYRLPGIHLLKIPPQRREDNVQFLQEQSHLLEATLENFHVNAKVVHVTKGPSVTRFEIQPAPGVKVSKVTGLTDDIKLSLAAKDIRIEAPIPGKNTIGIEVPNLESSAVFLREILRRDVFMQSKSPLTVALGLDISGQPIVTDLNKMPHGLVAGATGSGKSVCINSILISLLYKATPDQVKLLLIDPKMVELAPYNEVPHLITPVITDAKLATASLKWVVGEMERRYELFSQRGTRDIGRYNDLFSENGIQALPYIVVVIDELADLMMVSPQDVEESICRIAQKARACGIHLLLATQRPSVDVITGLIKANIPTRIAFSVSSQTDSRTIIDMNGAERLLGKGDMLFHENGTAKPIRVQGTFVSDDEIEQVIEHVRNQRKPQYLIGSEQLIKIKEPIDEDDELFAEACFFVMEQGGASSSSLQRKFRIGFNRAARLIDVMEEKGIISEAMGSKPRTILMNETELEDLFFSKD